MAAGKRVRRESSLEEDPMLESKLGRLKEAMEGTSRLSAERLVYTTLQ